MLHFCKDASLPSHSQPGLEIPQSLERLPSPGLASHHEDEHKCESPEKVRPRISKVEPMSKSATDALKISGENIVTPAGKPILSSSEAKSTKCMKALRFVEIDPSSLQSNRTMQTIQGLRFADTEADNAILVSLEVLWKTAGFSKTLAEFITKNIDSKLTLLVQDSEDISQKCGLGGCLVGFLIFRIDREKKYLSIRRVAIDPEFQRQGHGRRFIKWSMQQPGVAFLSLTALSKSVAFYDALGFRKAQTWSTGGKVRPDDEPELNNTYMEYHPSAGKGKKNKKR